MPIGAKRKKNPNMPKVNKSSSSTGEAIMICIDTSGWMQNKESPRFKQQADAIRFYCTQKFMSNPQTVVGISGMGERCLTTLITPTTNIALIMRSLYDAKLSGDLLIGEGVVYAHQVWFGCRGEELGVHLPKRMTVFAGGPVYYDKDDMKELGQALKEKNVACDAISFGHPARNKKELFDTLIAAADNYGNCNLVHVPPNSTVLAALFSSQIVQSGSASQESYSVKALSLSRSLSVQQQSSKLNAMAAASYPYSVNPVKIAAWSQSSLDLKLDNANPNWETVTLDHKIAPWSQSSLDLKLDNANPIWETVTLDQKIAASSQSSLDNANPNWQPETLDQKIERVKRELQSLIKQKNQQQVQPREN